MKTFYWLVKREFWEHRGAFFWAPVITGIVFLVLNIMGVTMAEISNKDTKWNLGAAQFSMNGESHVRPEDLVQAGAALDIALYVIAAIILSVMAIVVFFYCIGALYNERSDRSILFWKSLPLSDSATVLSKVVAGAVLAPAIATVVGVAVGLVVLVLLGVTASFHGGNLWGLLMAANPFKVVATLILMIPLYAIWALPTIGWLLLCSAAARSKPFLWAIALPVGAGVIASWFGFLDMLGVDSRWVWKHIVGRMLGSLLPGSWAGSVSPLALHDNDNPRAVLDGLGLAYQYSALAAPSAWIGALAGAAMIAAAIWFRRWRDDS
jgi:ABC-2 type transport system permease protein